MDIEFEVDVNRDERLLDEDELEKVLCSSDDSDDDYPEPFIDLPPYSEALSGDNFPKPAKESETEKQKKLNENLKKSVIIPGFEKLHSIPMPKSSQRALRLERKKEREKTKGPGWYNLPVQEMTEEVKNDIDILKMRSVLDPKHKYKKNDITHTPKYFQIGRVVETPADFYSSRIPKSQRKRTLVDELLADAESRAYQKKKFKAALDGSRQKGRKQSRRTKNK